MRIRFARIGIRGDVDRIDAFARHDVLDVEAVDELPEPGLEIESVVHDERGRRGTSYVAGGVGS